MSISITNTRDNKAPSLVLCVYGNGGIGKSTLAATAPKPIFIDGEGGTKAFGIRGINVPVINVRTWTDVQEAWSLIKDNPEYETVVVDPIGGFLDILIDFVRQGQEMNMKKWGEAKEKMRKFIFTVKESGRHVVFVAHEEEEKDEDQVIRKPLLKSNLSQELVNLCDVVGHLRIDKEGKRSLRVQPEQKYKAKDRFDVLGELIKEPNVTSIVKQIHDAYDKPPFESKPSEHRKQMQEAMNKAKAGLTPND